MSALKIDQVPSAFAAIGEKHNALVNVVKSMSGAGGISVKVSDANVIIDGSGISVAGGGGTEGDPIQVVGSTGLLNTVPKHSTWATPTTYPTNLAIVNGSVTASMNVAGFGYEDANATLAAAGYGVTYLRGSDGFRANPAGFFYDGSSVTAELSSSRLRWRNASVTFTADGSSVNYRTASATFVADASGIYYQTSTASATVNDTGFYIASGALAADVTTAGFTYEDASITAVLGASGLSIEDNGTNRMLIDELGLTWRNGAVTAYIDSDGFTFTNGSATGTLGAGNLTLESTTLVATYAVNKVAFSNGTQEAIVSATGFEYEDASITAVLGANGLRIEDNGTNEITVDELGIAWTNASSAWGISSTGLRYSDPAVLARFGDAGVQWTDGTNSFAATTIGFLMVTSTGSVSIPFSAVSGAIQLREIDVCENGVAKKMLILASQLY